MFLIRCTDLRDEISVGYYDMKIRRQRLARGLIMMVTQDERFGIKGPWW